MARKVLMAEVSGGRVRGRPRLGWMDGVNNNIYIGETYLSRSPMYYSARGSTANGSR